MLSTPFRLGFLVLLAAATLFAPQSAEAQYFGRNKVQYDRFDFRILPTINFDLHYYQETETAAQDAARMADRWYQRHATLFSHELTDRRPLIFYANDADFQQTNVIGGAIGQGTGGVTEGLKQRVVMPFTGLYSETDHVLGHELVHSFQYDLSLSAGIGVQIQRLPLWMIEGMAEYLSLGSHDPHTAMWLRDALARDDLPTIDDLATGRYFPYRFGQAYMAYLGGTYGDGAVTSLYTVAGRAGVEEGIQVVTGMTTDSLSADWIQTVKNSYGPLLEGRTPASEAGRRVLAKERGTGDINISPAVSPDGRYVAFLSTRDLFSINLYVADTQTGQIVTRLTSANRDAHFDAIRFINSAGTWSPDGRRFAFITFAKGDNELAIWDVQSGDIERRFSVQGVTALTQPSWSPDGESIVLSGMDGGISDLYVVDVESGRVRQLMNDRYGDLQPTWSPDGRQIAFVSDRGPNGTNFSILEYGSPRIALFDVETDNIEVLEPFARGLQHNPQFTPDGRGLYFISDHDGFKDVHYLELSTGRTAAITNLQTGASSFTSLSPAMSVAAQSGLMMFSVFEGNEYAVVALSPEELDRRRRNITLPEEDPADLVRLGPSLPDSTITDTLLVDPATLDTTVLARAGLLPPWTGPGIIDQTLETPTGGLPTAEYEPERPYRARLQLDAVAPPSIGVQVGGGFGTRLGGSVGFYFSDMLGNHNLSVEALANGRLQDIGGQLTYVNLKNRLNYGAQIGHIPFLFLRASAFRDQGSLFVVQEEERIFQNRVSFLGAYPLRNTRRFELQTGLTRYGFDTKRQVFECPSGFGCRLVDESSPDTQDPVYLSQSSAAYVVDFSNFGFTSPVQGGRYRLQVGSTFGSANYATVLADVRRYVRTGQVTFAGRLTHIGNYGAKQGDLFSEEYLGYSFTPTYVRGYSFYSFEPGECESATGSCAVLDRLIGTRVAVAGLEIRVPLFGTEQYGLFTFPYLPTELSVFTDAGLAWTAESDPVFKWERDSEERVPVVSAGVSARINLLGAAVFEFFYAKPFQRPDKGWFLGVNLIPGW